MGLIPSFSSAQSLVDQLDDSNEELLPEDLKTETIQKISSSKRIFILTNQNDSFQKGDFITLVLNKKLAARALVAKSKEDIAGIKILKIYSLSRWRRLREGKDVQIIRGDDSYFRLAQKDNQNQREDEDISSITSEEDLFNETTILEDNDSLVVEDDKNRAIKTDNIVSLYMGLFESLDKKGSTQRYNQLSGAWSYQFTDNMFGELSYGQNLINDYPSTGLDTKLTNITVRLKYSFSAPFYSYVLPYVGYQSVGADSPGAGGDGKGVGQEQKELELKMVDDLEENQLVFGVTVLKRLVPGWFFRADLGSDVIAGGFALEF